MSAGEAVRAALVAALALRRVCVSGVDAGAGVSPRVEVGDPASSDWGTKTARGREVRTMVSVSAARGQGVRLAEIVEAAEAAGEDLGGDIGGWCVASAVLVRSRGGSGAKVTAVIEHRVRVLET